MQKQIRTTLALSAATIMLLSSKLAAEEASSPDATTNEAPDERADRPREYYIRTATNTDLAFGVLSQEHRLGILASRTTGDHAYKTFGLEYAHHFNGTDAKEGFYAKLYWEHRRYERDLKVNVRHENSEWKHDLLKNHKAHHVGALLGYQWFFCNPHTFGQAGVGWQYNSNPAKVTTGPFGYKRSIRARQEVTAELGFGFRFQ